jgi:hypothetical protein
MTMDEVWSVAEPVKTVHTESLLKEKLRVFEGNVWDLAVIVDRRKFSSGTFKNHRENLIIWKTENFFFFFLVFQTPVFQLPGLFNFPVFNVPVF